MENKKERKIKITSKYFPRAWNDVIFPEIRLAGKWLKDAGFTCGQFVTITQQGNSITITALPEAQAEPPVKKAYKKKNSFIPPDIETLPGDQLFRRWAAADYRAYVEKVKEEKARRKKVTKERAWDEFKKTLKSNSNKVLQGQKNAGSEGQIIEMNIRPDQVADSSAQG